MTLRSQNSGTLQNSQKLTCRMASVWLREKAHAYGNTLRYGSQASMYGLGVNWRRAGAITKGQEKESCIDRIFLEEDYGDEPINPHM